MEIEMSQDSHMKYLFGGKEKGRQLNNESERPLWRQRNHANLHTPWYRSQPREGMIIDHEASFINFTYQSMPLVWPKVTLDRWSRSRGNITLGDIW